jgi:hypothetical protein
MGGQKIETLGENMADENQNHDWRVERDALDRELDAALAKYAAVEPRAGLEERVLANLGAERGHVAARVWWRWPALGLAAAALVVFVISLMWRPDRGKPNRLALETTSQRPPTTPPGDTQTGVHSATNDMGGQAHPTASAATKKPARHGVRHAQEIVASGPRLDHFPSPRPLSEEEKLLVRYVQDFPQEAIMIAKAQWESEMEMEKLKGSETSGASRVQQQDQQQDQQ